MKFFIPGVPGSQTETAYRALVDSAKAQLRTAISPKRIVSLRFIHDKRPVSLKVGEQYPKHYRYQILAILESQPHIVMTRGRDGKPGPTFMVSSLEITDVTEFDSEPIKVD